jgi:hypothetical protein
MRRRGRTAPSIRAAKIQAVIRSIRCIRSICHSFVRGVALRQATGHRELKSKTRDASSACLVGQPNGTRRNASAMAALLIGELESVVNDLDRRCIG